jgi:hypothetical protein
MSADVAGITMKNENCRLWVLCLEEPAMEHFAVTAREKNVLRGETHCNLIGDMLAFGVKQ